MTWEGCHLHAQRPRLCRSYGSGCSSVSWYFGRPAPPQVHLYTTPHLSCCSQNLHLHLPGRGLEIGLASHGCVWGASDHCIWSKRQRGRNEQF